MRLSVAVVKEIGVGMKEPSDASLVEVSSTQAHRLAPDVGSVSRLCLRFVRSVSPNLWASLVTTLEAEVVSRVSGANRWDRGGAKSELALLPICDSARPWIDPVRKPAEEVLYYDGVYAHLVSSNHIEDNAAYTCSFAVTDLLLLHLASFAGDSQECQAIPCTPDGYVLYVVHVVSPAAGSPVRSGPTG